jgi:hypothetical protein
MGNGTRDFINPPERSRVVVDEWYSDSGAIMSGRRTWEREGAFVTDGIESALEQTRVIESDGVTHLDYRVVK